MRKNSNGVRSSDHRGHRTRPHVPSSDRSMPYSINHVPGVQKYTGVAHASSFTASFSCPDGHYRFLQIVIKV
ncbi:hypothetical protein TNCV_3257941 [Trichonephila clavipes]|nr:hypothetical protein TNCV_3257941 [Trichonephila clavipes]